MLLFQYAVASATIAAVNKPLLRLELYVSKSSTEPGLGTSVFPEDQIQPVVAEFSKAQLDTLLAAMDAIEQVHHFLRNFLNLSTLGSNSSLWHSLNA